MNNREYLVIGLVAMIASGLGCIENTSEKVTVEDSANSEKSIGVNHSEQGKQPVINTLSNDDREFLSSMKTSIDRLKVYIDMMPSGTDADYYERLKISGQSMQKESERYLYEAESRRVSPELKEIYDEYILSLKSCEDAGLYCKIAAETTDTDIGIKAIEACSHNISQSTGHFKTINRMLANMNN